LWHFRAGAPRNLAQHLSLARVIPVRAQRPGVLQAAYERHSKTHTQTQAPRHWDFVVLFCWTPTLPDEEVARAALLADANLKQNTHCCATPETDRQVWAWPGPDHRQPVMAPVFNVSRARRARSAWTRTNGDDWGWCMQACPIRVHIRVGADQVAGMAQHEVMCGGPGLHNRQRRQRQLTTAR
jgi:hypothetical protein